MAGGKMSRDTLIIDNDSIIYTFDLYRGSESTWFDSHYTVEEIDEFILQEARGELAVVAVTDRRDWDRLSERMQKHYDAKLPQKAAPRKDCDRYYYGELGGWPDKHNLRVRRGGNIWMTRYE